MVEGLIADRAKVREALILLLDSRWGINRIHRVREAVQMLPKWSSPFVGTAKPLNYLVECCKDIRGNTPPMLQLLKETEEEHAKLWAKFRTDNPKYTARHDVLVRNTRALRLCYQQAITIETLKQGSPLTAEKKEEVKEAYRKMWNEWRDKYLVEHADGKRRQVMHESARERDARMKAMCDEAVAKANPNREVTKDERKLNRLLKQEDKGARK